MLTLSDICIPRYYLHRRRKKPVGQKRLTLNSFQYYKCIYTTIYTKVYIYWKLLIRLARCFDDVSSSSVGFDCALSITREKFNRFTHNALCSYQLPASALDSWPCSDSLVSIIPFVVGSIPQNWQEARDHHRGNEVHTVIMFFLLVAKTANTFGHIYIPWHNMRCPALYALGDPHSVLRNTIFG